MSGQDETNQASQVPDSIAAADVPLQGRVEQLIQGRRYAFIRLVDGRGVYAHWSALRGTRFAELRPGQQMDCWLDKGALGLQAARVRPCRRRRQRKHVESEGTLPQ